MSIFIVLLVMVLASSAGAQVCGDSNPDSGEECDDGNTTPGDGCSAVCTIEAGFDCTAAVAGQDTQNLLNNGSFESGVAPWTNTGTPFAPISSPLICGGCDLSLEQQGGGWYWAGGAGSASSTSATQTLVIPVTATTLEFAVWDGFCVPEGGVGDFVTIEIDGNEVYDSGSCNTTGFYDTFPVIDLTTAPGGPYNDGGAHTIAALGSMDFTPGDPQTGSILMDNFSVSAPLEPPIPPTPSMCTAIVCGDSVLGSTEQCDDGNAIPGDGCSMSCQIEQPNFVCDDPLPPAASGEDVVDGGLEDTTRTDDWSQTGTQFNPICSQVFCGAALANDGAFFGWFGGSLLPNNQTLTQDVLISSTSTDLTFDLLVAICDSANDSLTVEIDGTEIYRYDCTASTAEYETQTAPLGAFADGGLHTLRFIGDTVATNGGNSNFFVDNISIRDNVQFGGLPGSCTELATACNVPEQFDSPFPPTGWTVFNVGPNSFDGWGRTDDGICASQGWSPGNPDNNATNGGGFAACADSNATGQIDIDAGGAPDPMETYLCTPSLDLTQVTDPVFSFQVNYQADRNALNDNGTPGDPSDDFDDDFLQMLIGSQPPDPATIQNYFNLGLVFDHLDSTLGISRPTEVSASLLDHSAQSAAHVCFRYRGTYAWFAQIDNAALRGSECVAPADSDGDGVPDSTDNCTLEANTDQRDTDGDGIGNVCDADLNDDCIVNTIDLGIMKSVFFGAPANPDADLDNNGAVDFADLGRMKSLFFQPPGPGATSCTESP